jgi:hypothetical protein
MSEGTKLLIDFCRARRLGAADFHSKLPAAAGVDPFATPRDVPRLRRVFLWLTGDARPNRSNRRLIALATGGNVRGDAIVGGAVPVEAWTREAGE